MFRQIVGKCFKCCLYRNRKTDTFGVAEDHGVDAEHAAQFINERPAAVPWIDRRIGLYQLGLTLLPIAGKDSPGYGVAQPARVADGIHFLSELNLLNGSGLQTGQLLLSMCNRAKSCSSLVSTSTAS